MILRSLCSLISAWCLMLGTTETTFKQECVALLMHVLQNHGGKRKKAMLPFKPHYQKGRSAYNQFLAENKGMCIGIHSYIQNFAAPEALFQLVTNGASLIVHTL